MNFYTKSLLVFTTSLNTSNKVIKKVKQKSLEPVKAVKINKEINDEIATLTSMHADVFARFKECSWPLQHTANMQLMEFYQLNLQKLNRMIMGTQSQNILKSKALQNILRDVYIDNICADVSKLFFEKTGIYIVVTFPQIGPYGFKQTTGNLMLSPSRYQSYNPLDRNNSKHALDKIMEQIKSDSKIMGSALDTVLSKYIAKKIDDTCTQINELSAKIKSGEIIPEEDEKVDDNAEKF